MAKKIFVILLIILSISQLWFLNLVIKGPVIVIDIFKEGNHWFIESIAITTYGVNEEIRTGDEVVKVDGIMAGEHPHIKKWRMIQQAEDITIKRDNHIIEVQLADYDYGFSIQSIIGGFLSLYLAVIILLKIRNSKSANLLAMVFFVTGFTFMSVVASSRGDALGKYVLFTLLLLLPFVIFHFLITFFNEKGGIKPSPLSNKLIKIFYYIALGNGIFNLGLLIPNLARIFFELRSITYILFVLGCLMIIFYLTNMYFKFKGQKTYLNTLIKTIWFSLLLSMSPLAFFYIVPLLINGKEWISGIYAGWFVLLFPLSFTYLLLTKQLYDIHLVLRRFLFTSLISLVPAVIITIIFVYIADSMKWLQAIAVFVLTVFIFSVILYSLEYIITRLEHVMFPRKYHLQAALKKIASKLRTIKSFRELKDIILVDIVNTLEVYGGAIVIKYKDDMEIIDEGFISTKEVKALIEAQDLDHPEYTCLHIHCHEEYSSYLVMTKKRTNTMLGLEERQWLGLIVSYLSVSLENLYLIRKLTSSLQDLVSEIPNAKASEEFVWIRKMMFEIQENERVRLATDLHDTTMQDLFFLKRRLHNLMEDYVFTKADQERLSSLMEYIEIINTNLRENCFELNPYLLSEIGLAKTIEKVVEKESVDSAFDIRFEVEDRSSIERLEFDAKRHVFRIFQELLNNAKKHSEASQVSFHMGVQDDRLIFNYQDDGKGLKVEPLIEREIGGSGMGMQQIRSRVLHMNGHIGIQSQEHRGTKITMDIPIH